MVKWRLLFQEELYFKDIDLKKVMKGKNIDLMMRGFYGKGSIAFMRFGMGM